MNAAPETRYSLIGKLRDPQDAEAWAEFSTIYQPLIMRIARSKGLQHADATDVTQEVLTRVAKAIPEFDSNRSGATFRGWLYRITRNLVVDFIRSKSRGPRIEAAQSVESAQGIDAAWSDPSQAEIDSFQREYQRQLFVLAADKVQQTVKANTWQAFWRTEIEQEAVESVAKDLGISAGSIYVARSRILAKLKAVVDQHMSETNS